jgi:hypothetical protein
LFELPYVNLLTEELYLLVLDALKHEGAVKQPRHFE